MFRLYWEHNVWTQHTRPESICSGNSTWTTFQVMEEPAGYPSINSDTVQVNIIFLYYPVSVNISSIPMTLFYPN